MFVPIKLKPYIEDLRDMDEETFKLTCTLADKVPPKEAIVLAKAGIRPSEIGKIPLNKNLLKLLTYSKRI